ncbi:hypothetical protein DV515_00009283 [Chloebia gouldiae]|uniref:Uncharacterized protein n=1 Tax=Chloebia gouldiae TaxID=44316 RepID=A0A3L8SCI3_CHLGU|nr:hypothetical protein DV515_00009283 [Chloebia gouldiae]
MGADPFLDPLLLCGYGQPFQRPQKASCETDEAKLLCQEEVMSSQGQEVSKMSEDKEQPCPAKTEVIPEIGAHQTKLGSLIMVGYWETNPKHSHQELALSGGHSLSHSADVSALNQGCELGEHHRGDN